MGGLVGAGSVTRQLIGNIRRERQNPRYASLLGVTEKREVDSKGNVDGMRR